MACECKDLTGQILHFGKRGIVIQTEQYWAGQAMFGALYTSWTCQANQDVAISQNQIVAALRRILPFRMIRSWR
jgi:hypothetical protein